MSHSSFEIRRVNMVYHSTRDVFGIIVLFSYFLNIYAADPYCLRPPQLVDPQTCCTDGGRDEVSERCARRYGITGGPSQQPPNAETASCLAECVLTESGYMVGQNLNLAAIQMNLQRKFPGDPQFVATMTRSYQKCVPIAQKKLEDLRKTPQGVAALQRRCSPFSGIVLGCTYTDYFVNCPPGHWTASQQCQTAKQFLQRCAIY